MEKNNDPIEMSTHKAKYKNYCIGSFKMVIRPLESKIKSSLILCYKGKSLVYWFEIIMQSVHNNIKYG